MFENAFVIKDIETNEYYLRGASKSGWYGKNLSQARFYSKYEEANKTIAEGNHHVSYPNRLPNLKIITIILKEL